LPLARFAIRAGEDLHRWSADESLQQRTDSREISQLMQSFIEIHYAQGNHIGSTQFQNSFDLPYSLKDPS
jgi:hypothetical protein